MGHSAKIAFIGAVLLASGGASNAATCGTVKFEDVILRTVGSGKPMIMLDDPQHERYPQPYSFQLECTVGPGGRLACSAAAVESKFRHVAANTAEFLNQLRAAPRPKAKNPVGGCMLVDVRSDGTNIHMTGAKVR